MRQYLSKRIFSSILAITGLFGMVFFLARLTGDPGHLYLPIDAPLEVRKEFSEKHGFNDPIYIQFGKFLGDLSDGNLGYSLRKERPAIDIVLEAIPVTLSLAAVAMSIALVGAILIGSLAAYRPNGIFDRISRVVSLTAASAPDFWVAITAISVSYTHLTLPTKA